MYQKLPETRRCVQTLNGSATLLQRRSRWQSGEFDGYAGVRPGVYAALLVFNCVVHKSVVVVVETEPVFRSLTPNATTSQPTSTDGWRAAVKPPPPRSYVHQSPSQLVSHTSAQKFGTLRLHKWVGPSWQAHARGVQPAAASKRLRPAATLALVPGII